METTNRKLVDQLEEILEKNRDAQKGYAKAAENADSPQLQNYFKRKSTDRMQFNETLKRELVATYDEIDDDGSFSGTIHRAWMDLKSLFGDTDESMLEEAIRGDKAAVKEYEEVLEKEALTPKVASIIREQHMKIRTDLNEIKSLEDLKD